MIFARRPAAAALVAVLAACSADPSPTPPPPCPTQAPSLASAQATLEDARLATVTVTGAVEGEFSIALYGDEAPLATANFVSLARCGFYDGQWFHRILAGFVIQAGDPGTKTHDRDWAGLGKGGPGYGFEIEPPAPGLRYDRYTVAMANDRVVNGSQWFVCLTDLDGQLRAVGVYTIFGAVVSGTNVIDEIAAVPVNDPEVGVPLEQVTIERIEISAAPVPSPSDE
ncbi:MAG TPA: peptidylprolyl isomerase [Candidatus Limnocylindria bacterium]|nr:peptidylprolyl isomerase [Candidatus Limnocylindria bacterium]